MLVSAVVGGLILISMSSVISQVQSQTFESSDTQDQISLIEKEAEIIYQDDFLSSKERENFKSIVNSLNFRSDFEFGSDHVNVTLISPKETYNLKNLGK